MPFQSEKQRRFLHANHPEIAKRWERDYATGGISNHFRKRRGFMYGSPSEDAARSYAGTHAGEIAAKGGHNGEGGGGHHPPVYTGPTPAEIAAQKAAVAAAKAKAEAEKRALEAAARKKYLADFKSTQKKKVKHKKEIEDMGFNEWQKFGTGVIDHYANLEKQNKIKAGKLDFGEQEWQNLIVPGLMNLKTSTLETPEYDFSEIEGQEAGLTKKQKQMLSGSQKNLKNIMGISNEEILENIKMWDDPDDPATIKDIETFYSAKGGVARKNYYHGGILDINESEEIIDDGGNEIELTDYNAAFDDPNDLSTGVKSLFQAKDGGRIGFYRGSDRHPGTSSSSTSYGPPGSASRASAPTHQPSPDRGSTPSQPVRHHAVDTPTQIKEQRQLDIQQDIQRREDEKYDTEEQMIQDKWTYDTPGQVKRHTYIIGEKQKALNKAQDALQKKLKKTGTSRLFQTIIMLALGLPPPQIIGKKDLYTAYKYGMPLIKAQNEYKTALKNAKDIYEELGIPQHSPHTDTPLQDVNQQLLDLTQTRDKYDKGDGGPEPILDPVTLEVGTEYAQGDYGMSDLDRIRAGQAKRAMLVDKGIIQDNPIVDESITDITMTANSGGLANLFRVKNQ
jgi:hypothetical protein